ncbi:MAG: DUF362 domain-containing protein [Thermodesulfobacteriota bacterium]
MATINSLDRERTVIIRRLDAAHQTSTFREFRPLGKEMNQAVQKVVVEMFDALGGPSLIKSSGDVYIKPNVVGTNAYVHTRPEVTEAAVRYWQAAGARRVFVLENSTQATYTRLVFEMTGYNALCKRTGAVPVYLDEEKSVPYDFTGKPPADKEPRGYERTTFGLPRTVHEKLILERDANLYVSLPKLKTHSMSVVTLGIKNQWGFPVHRDRSPDHNYNLHHKLADVLSLVRPDVTLIEGVEGTIHGHYPALALADRCVRPFRVMIGGRNVVAVDIVGAGVFGQKIADVPHLKIAVEKGLGGAVRSEADIIITGDYTSFDDLDILGEWDRYGGSYPFDLIQEFPENITIIKGKEMACREGCVNNSLNTLQMLAFDHRSRGGWTLAMGKGFDQNVIDGIAGPVFVVGPCAVNEIGDRLVERLGRSRVYFSRECNDLTAIVESLCHLMRVSPLKLAPPINPIKGLYLIHQARQNNSTARMTNPAANIVKFR